MCGDLQGFGQSCVEGFPVLRSTGGLCNLLLATGWNKQLKELSRKLSNV